MKKVPLYSFLILFLNSIIFGFYLISIIINNHLSFLIFSTLFILIILNLIVFIVSLLYVQRLKNVELVPFNEIENKFLTVVLTAYNDELSISDAVKDFLQHSLVKRVIVISNNSSDKTIENAIEAGAVVYNEQKQGYGACVYRALSEGIKYNDTDLTLLCEGDMTFRAYDISKFMSYLPHADIVAGTRIVDQLRNKNTQLSTFMFYGNFFVGKILELKHLSKGTFTDVGTTYKLCKNATLKELLPKLDNSINLEFNPYFIDIALQNNIKVVECPITFHQRVGISKGGNINNIVAFKLGIRMLKGLIFRW
jgi:glycosyltransferase involved in cell wall biosynthesis